MYSLPPKRCVGNFISSMRCNIDTAESLLVGRKEIDQLQHLVRKHPIKAMECLTYNQMLKYIMSHRNIAVDLEKAKVELVGVSADTL